MFGVLLASVGALFEEVADVIGKAKMKAREESIYGMAFLSFFWGPFWFLAVILWKHQFVFQLASLPVFIPRVILEIIQIHFTVRAIAKADRSTFSFIRTGTIPLLIAADIMLGYPLAGHQIAGMALIALALALIFAGRAVAKDGMLFIILSTIGAAATTTLYKYDIAHFNSVEAEQFVLVGMLVVYFFLYALIIRKENLLRLLGRRTYFIQSFSSGFGGVLESFAFLFAPASIITAARRAASVLWGVLSGNVYFHEKHIFLKIAFFTLLAAGTILLV